MTYRVELTPRAEAELWDDFAYICERAPLNAQRWLLGMYQAIDTLETYPARWAVAPESQFVDDELRHLLFNMTALTMLKNREVFVRWVS